MSSPLKCGKWIGFRACEGPKRVRIYGTLGEVRWFSECSASLVAPEPSKLNTLVQFPDFDCGPITSAKSAHKESIYQCSRTTFLLHTIPSSLFILPKVLPKVSILSMPWVDKVNQNSQSTMCYFYQVSYIREHLPLFAKHFKLFIGSLRCHLLLTDVWHG